MKATLTSLATFLLLVLTSRAQIAETPKYAVPAPPTGAQIQDQLGYSVAVDGGYIVVGVPYDSKGAQQAGVVKIFDSTSGNLLLTLPNPSPHAGDNYGFAVAISGTRVVVGAYQEAVNGVRVGCAYIYDLASITPATPIFTLDNPNPVGFSGFGVSVSVSGALVVVGAFADNTGAAQAGQAYVYDLSSDTPTVPAVTLANPAPVADDEFGISVAIDGKRILVGANQNSAGAGGPGIAYVYDLSDTTPEVPIFTLNDPATAGGDRFGQSVAISGTLAVVGAYQDSTGAAKAGSAYVFDLSSASPTVPVTTLNDPVATASDAFGFAVAISGTQVVVGAYGDDTGASNAGSGYVYDLASATPTTPVITLHNPNPQSGDNFGFAAAISGTRAVIGAPEDDLNATDAGSAYVYELSNATPTIPLATINSPGPATWDQFGSSIAISGPWMVVGSPGIGSGGVTGAYAGSAFVYNLSSPTPTVPVVTLNNPDQVAKYGQFGISVAIDGTLVVVGAHHEDTGATDAGSAYVYDISSATPSVPIAVFHDPTPAASDFFGRTVAISGTRVVVGAPGDDTGATDAGAAYVYDLTSATPTAPVFALNKFGPTAGDMFGSAVAIAGALVVVGVPNDDTAGFNTGAAYVYNLTVPNPRSPVIHIYNPNPRGPAAFGSSLAISGTRLVVGAPVDGPISMDGVGRAFVYDLASDTPDAPLVTLNNPSPATEDYFGFSVGISGTRVVVAAPQADAGATDAGVAYLYDLAGVQPAAHTAVLHNPNPVVTNLADLGAQFGHAVAIDGKTVVIGVPFDNTVVYHKGYAYVFASTATANDQNGDGLLDSWELAHFGNTDERDLLVDEEHDGLGNLLEEAFGTDPLMPDAAAAPAVVNEGGYLTITITKHPGVTYLVQSAATSDPAAFSDANTTVLLDNPTTLKVRDNVLIGAAPSRFLRVKVTAAP